MKTAQCFLMAPGKSPVPVSMAIHPMVSSSVTVPQLATSRRSRAREAASSDTLWQATVKNGSAYVVAAKLALLFVV